MQVTMFSHVDPDLRRNQKQGVFMRPNAQHRVARGQTDLVPHKPDPRFFFVENRIKAQLDLCKTHLPVEFLFLFEKGFPAFCSHLGLGLNVDELPPLGESLRARNVNAGAVMEANRMLELLGATRMTADGIKQARKAVVIGAGEADGSVVAGTGGAAKTSTKEVTGKVTKAKSRPRPRAQNSDLEEGAEENFESSSRSLRSTTTTSRTQAVLANTQIPPDDNNNGTSVVSASTGGASVEIPVSKPTARESAVRGDSANGGDGDSDGDGAWDSDGHSADGNEDWSDGGDGDDGGEYQVSDSPSNSGGSESEPEIFLKSDLESELLELSGKTFAEAGEWGTGSGSGSGRPKGKKTSGGGPSKKDSSDQIWAGAFPPKLSDMQQLFGPSYQPTGIHLPLITDALPATATASAAASLTLTTQELQVEPDASPSENLAENLAAGALIAIGTSAHSPGPASTSGRVEASSYLSSSTKTAGAKGHAEALKLAEALFAKLSVWIAEPHWVLQDLFSLMIR